jgi:hypothetical protein
MRLLLLLAPLLLAAPLVLAAAPPARPGLPDGAAERAVAALVAKHGPAQEARIRRGVSQVAERWWPQDGDEAAFQALVAESFLASPADLDAMAARLEAVLEQVDGHLHEVSRVLSEPMHLDTGPVRPWDQRLADLSLQTHVAPDLFATKVAFLALLNFPVHTLSDRLSQGASWDRATWARSRMMDRFAARIPAEVGQEVTRAFNAAEQYIADYNIFMGRLVAEDGAKPFPADLKLITHWGLRDELKSHYGQGDEGLRRQRMIQKVMERIVRSEVPACVIDSDAHEWAPFANRASGSCGPEPDTRYARILEIFRAVRRADPYNPVAPTFLRARFEQDRQIPEAEVEALLVSILESPEVRDIAKLVAARVGRPLEPFDIWYSGFKPGRGTSEAELDQVVRGKYPTVAAFQADLPRILRELGFAPERAEWLAARIAVDPSRGAGHAMGAVRREDKAHLRTRIPREGMNYKGWNIAIHELGHNVEQVFSLNAVDHWFLAGVPNNAFTEALAFVFQQRDLELLGLASPGVEAQRLEALDDVWGAYEIGGVALVDMRVWRWMYDHPDATPAQLKEATLAAAREVWNRWYAPVLGAKDVELLAVYSHMVSNGLYLPDYPIGHVIASQLAASFRKGDFGREFERVTRQGRLTPEAWMRGAVGAPVSAQAMLAEARKALDAGTR